MASGAPDTTTEPIEALVRHAAGLFKALADPLRLQLVALTRTAPGGEVCFCDLIDVFGIPQSSLSHHLGVLVSAGILDRERRGTWSWYRLRPAALGVLQDVLDEDGALSRAARGNRSPLLPDPDTSNTLRCTEPGSDAAP